MYHGPHFSETMGSLSPTFKIRDASLHMSSVGTSHTTSCIPGFAWCQLLVFRVYFERPMVIDSLNLKLRQIARFLSKVILDEISSAKCRLLFGFFLVAQHEERPLYHIHMVTSRFIPIIQV